MKRLKVFIAGPRAVTSLNPVVSDRITGLIQNGATILVGDASGVDSLVQQCFVDLNYRNVVVYASNGKARNNIGKWEIRNVPAGEKTKGFDFFACKDLKMAEDADYGFMIWNGKSKGTLSNMVNLVRLGKEVLVYFIPHKKFYKINSMGGVQELTSICGSETGRILAKLSAGGSAMQYEQTSLDFSAATRISNT